MLDALLGVKTFPPTQQVITEPPPETIPVVSQTVVSANRPPNTLMIASLIAASLVAALVLLTTMTTRTSQPIAQPTTSPSLNPIDYSWLAQRPVTNADLNNKDGLELDIMRNSIYARRGRRFATTLLQQHFERQAWYRPLYPPDEFDKLNASLSTSVTS